MKKPLKQLLNALDAVFEIHEEVGDTDVREQMYDAVHKTYIVPQPDYRLPTKFGMFSEDGNKMVHDALEKFFKHPDVIAAGKNFATPEERLAAFQDSEVHSNDGNGHDEYFGFADAP